MNNSAPCGQCRDEKVTPVARGQHRDEKLVTLAVNGRFHAFSLATEFAQLRRLGRLFCAYHTLTPPRYVARGQFRNHLGLALWQDLGLRFARTSFSFEAKSQVFDRWLERYLRAMPPGILHGWNSHLTATLASLAGSGWVRCVERSCPDNLFQHHLLLEESRRTGVPYHFDLARIQRAHEELYQADVIVAPSLYSAISYSDPELRRKVRINPLGGNFVVEDVQRRSDDPLRVLFVGNNFLRKGVHDLVEAFRMVPDRRASLRIRGEVPAEFRDRIHDARIDVVTPVTRERLRGLFRWANVFCLPSVDEGFGMVVLEALAFGLPVVVTEHVGSRDLLDRRVALTVPIRAPAALAEAIQAARMLTGDAFEEARRGILARATWAACARRMLQDVYR